jgi:preprotein translocase subunit SecG
MESATLEKAILILAEVQRSANFMQKVSIIMLCVMFVVMVASLYLTWLVRNDTIYIKRRMESGD